MASSSERNGALQAVEEPEGSDPELESQLHVSAHYQLELQKEKHRHAEDMRKGERDHEVKIRQMEMGWIGRLVGGERQAPISIAMIVVVVGALIMWASYRLYPALGWQLMFQTGGALVSGALGYIFGRAS